MYSEKGLSNVYHHYIDKNGNKFFNTYNQFFGDFIRQVKTPDGLMIDACEGQIFDDIMDRLGMIKTIQNNEVLYSTYDNFEKFIMSVENSTFWDGFTPKQKWHIHGIVNGHYSNDDQTLTEYPAVYNR